MRILLLSLQDENQDAAPAGSTRARVRRLEEEQTLALVRAMRDGGRLAPLLVSSRARACTSAHAP